MIEKKPEEDLRNLVILEDPTLIQKGRATRG